MSSADSKHAFALTLKRWFNSNEWPQKITDDWAKDEGVLAPNGPWASQICSALKADFHPRVEFFIALARFNQFVADQDLRSVQGSKLRDRLKGAKPLTDDAGNLYGATEFFALFAGLAEPPQRFASSGELTQEEMDAVVLRCQELFRKWALDEMMSRSEAWKLLSSELLKDSRVKPEHLPAVQEALAGLSRFAVEDMPEAWARGCPVTKALEHLAA